MRIFKTLRSHQASFSTVDGSVNLTAPKSWHELTQDQLRYVLTLLAMSLDSVSVKTYMLFRFTGIHVISRDRFGWKCYTRDHWWSSRRFFTIQAWQVESLLGQFDYVDSYDSMNNRLEVVRGLRAVDIRLHGVRFLDYLNAEKYYQAYIINQDDRFLVKLAQILYRRKDGSMVESLKLDAAELLGVHLWYSYIKSEFAKAFPHFFRKIGPEAVGDFDMLAAVNAQVRALTDGDVTKEEQIFNTECWRALTELDNKAREAAEFKKRMKK